LLHSRDLPRRRSLILFPRDPQEENSVAPSSYTTPGLNGNHNGRQARPSLTPRDAWAIEQRKHADTPIPDGEFPDLSPHIRSLLDFLCGLPAEVRAFALQAYVLGLPEPDQQLLFNVDPKGGLPPAGPAKAPLPARSPSLADLVDRPEDYFFWKDRMVRSHLNVLFSEVKTGKTRLIGEFVGRIWKGEPFPDEERVIFPEKTTTLWVCGDRHQDELRDLLRAYKIPLEAIHLCARPENPYGNCILEENDTIDLMAHYAENEKPAFICIDTIWRATNKKMKLEEDVNSVFDPIIEIAQRTGCTILCASHLSKDGDTLGRRLEGAARSVTKLLYPDPDGQKNRRRLITKGNFKQPDDLGLL
jgi:hypothetical protein